MKRLHIPYIKAALAPCLVKIHTAELTERGDSLLLKIELCVNREVIGKRQSRAIPQLVASDWNRSKTNFE